MEHIKKVINVSSTVLFILTTLSIILLSSTTFAVTEERNLQVTVPVSCNLAIQETTAHTAIADPGMYADDIGESTLTAICNDSAGFAIYAMGYSNDEYGNNTLVNTTTPTQTIASGTATSGPTSNWAMKLTPVTGTYEPTIVGSTLDLEKEQSTPDFSSYTEIPSTYTKVAYRNSNTDATTGAKLKSTYATYIASNQYAGTYEGKVKYTLVHPASEEAPLMPMQNFQCSSIINIGDSTTLEDIRDGKQYEVVKLQDGKCWMKQELMLDIVDIDVQANLNERTTNASNTTLNYLKNGGGTGQYTATPVSDERTNDSYDKPQIAFDYGYYFYNACAASAGSYCFKSLSSYTAEEKEEIKDLLNKPNTLIDIEEDICPKGWRLPTGGANGEYQTLFSLYNNNSSDYIQALALGLPGFFSGSGIVNLNVSGNWWSSTYNENYTYYGHLYYLYKYRSDIDASNNNYYGRERRNVIRCIAGN